MEEKRAVSSGGAGARSSKRQPARPHPIEVESYRRIAAEIDLGQLPPLSRALAARVVHATAEPAYVDDLVLDEAALRAGVAALERGAPVVTDVEMTRAGLADPLRRQAVSALSYGGGPAVGDPPGVEARADVAARRPSERSGLPETARQAAPSGSPTRSASGMTAALTGIGPGAVVVVGCAPTALMAVLEAAGQGVRPAFVVGVPVGYVGAVEAKAALRRTELPSVSNRSRRGGSAVAAAAVNALARLAGVVPVATWDPWADEASRGL